MILQEKRIRKSLSTMAGIQNFWQYGVEECGAVSARLPEMHLLHVDLCRAYLREGNPDAAERHLHRAVELGFFLPGLVHNLHACIDATRNDFEGVKFDLDQAFECYPYQVVIENQERFESWLSGRGSIQKYAPLQLVAGDDFESTSVCVQPEFPGLTIS